MKHLMDLQACDDCYQFIANGDNVNIAQLTVDAVQRWSKNQYLVASGAEENWFSWSACQVCREKLGGMRNKISVLVVE